MKQVVAASLAIGAIAVALYFGLAGRSPKIDLNPYTALGAVTAEETVKLLGDRGQVLVMVRDSGEGTNPSVEAELKAFHRVLKKHSGISQVTEKIVGTPMVMMATGGGVPAEQLFQALATHAKVGAVALFGGLPPLTHPEAEALKKRGAKIVVVSSFHPDYRRLLEQQVIHAAIVPRPDAPPPGARAPRTLREQFDQDYAVVTLADLAR